MNNEAQGAYSDYQSDGDESPVKRRTVSSSSSSNQTIEDFPEPPPDNLEEDEPMTSALGFLQQQQESGLFLQNAASLEDDDLSKMDFHPDEPIPPGQFNFATYLENLRATVNIFLKRRLQEPILQNTRKLVLQANRGEQKTYDSEFDQIIAAENEDDFDEVDIESIISKEYNKLTRAPYSSRHASKRSMEYQMERFQDSKIFKKLSAIYYPVDKTSISKFKYQLPCLQVIQAPPGIQQAQSFKRQTIETTNA